MKKEYKLDADEQEILDALKNGELAPLKDSKKELNNLMFINIADPRVLAIPIQESHEILIDLKDQNILQFGPPPECEETKDCYTKLRKTIYEKLCKAQENLPHGWKFKIYEGYRSLDVQDILFNWISAKIDRENPGLDLKTRFEKITQLVSPLKTLEGKINVPAHNTGAAVDLELLDTDGNLVDLGMEVKDWILLDPQYSQTHSPLISRQAQSNRDILLEVMRAQDFVNYPSEFWHFSYGDRGNVGISEVFAFFIHGHQG